MNTQNLFADENRAQALFIALEKQALEQKTLLSELKTWMRQIEKNLKGDVIEQGGVKNVHIYNYDPRARGSYGMVHEPDPILLPEKLQTPEADYMRDRLISAGMIDSMWQPVGLSGSERSLLAREVCDRLGINDVWQMFGQLWSEKPGTLRCYYNRAMEQKKTYVFLEKIKNILG